MQRHSLRFGKLAFGIVPLIIAALFLLALFLPLASQAIGPRAAQADSDWSAPPSINRSATRLDSSWADHQWDWQSLEDEQGFVDVILFDPLDTLDFLRTNSDYVRDSFSYAFSGFSAQVPADLLEIILFTNEDVKAYPDLPIHSMLADAIPQIGADQIWARIDPNGNSVTGKNIVVAVIDTGVDYNHPDLGGGFGPMYKVIGGYDFRNNDADPMDDNGHGTHVAGIIAASGGITGVAPDAKILAYKVLGSDGSGSMSSVISAIDRAIDPNDDGDTSDHADVISMSLGGPGEIGDPVTLAVAQAVNAGVVVVVAAGNDGPSFGSVASPGVAPQAITVGAMDDSSVLASFSSRGTAPELGIKPEICAPGVGIVSTVPDVGVEMGSMSGYASLSGTSMATPFVSGASALLIQLHPTWTPEMVKSAIITGAKQMNESIWRAGAGALWLPDAADSSLLATPSLVSYGLAGEPSVSVSVFNDGTASASISLASTDYYSLSADGATPSKDWVNKSAIAPSSAVIGVKGNSSFSLSVAQASPTSSEGYYDGKIVITHGSKKIGILFGYAVLSRLNVHVMNAAGQEVYDPYGGVWVYDVPSANVAMGRRGDIEPSPPASFLLPSGQYSVHALGHQLIYSYSDPYLLSGLVSLARGDVKDIYLNMSTAKQMTLDLSTDDGNPIYVKDYRVFCRYEGSRNLSFHLIGSDYSIKGAEIFTLPKSKIIYVTDTAAKVGISIAGFSYSSGMWEFMKKNWQHWYEYSSGISNDFYIEASTDLHYLLAWEFSGITATTPLSLDLVPGQYSTYMTKYDIPGKISNIWGDWGSHRSIGGDGTFYVRRDTDTSLNAFFSGMTRKMIVQGVFSEVYFPTSLFDGYIEPQYYLPDYSHTLRASTISEIYLPDRNFLTPITGVNENVTLGSGPFYPSVRTLNTNSSMVLFHPLLRDQSGARIGGTSAPMMYLNKDGNLVGIYQLSEHLSRPDAKRIVALSGSGSYAAKISYVPSPQICSSTSIELGFTVPQNDINPPKVTGLQMAKRYVPGQNVDLTLFAIDDKSPVTVDIAWRQSGTTSWNALAVSKIASDQYRATIPTTSSDASVDIEIRVTDGSGNYLDYITTNAAKQQIPVIFDLSVQDGTLEFAARDQTVILTGRLTEVGGAPLNSVGAVPLEMHANGKKVGMVLDEYMDDFAHSHNGSIRFEWKLDPTKLFTGPNETINVDVAFDIGLYQPKSASFSLNSIPGSIIPPPVGNPPVITLISPANNSLILKGLSINLNISDDGTFLARYSLDGGSWVTLGAPFDVLTSMWADGGHILQITVTDDDGLIATASFNFESDGTPPVITMQSGSYGELDQPFNVVAEITDGNGIYSVSLYVEFSANQFASTPMTKNASGYYTDISSDLLWNGMSIYVRAIDIVGNIAQTPEMILHLNTSSVDDGGGGGNSTNQTDGQTNNTNSGDGSNQTGDMNQTDNQNNNTYDHQDNQTSNGGFWMQNIPLIAIIAIAPAFLLIAAIWRRKDTDSDEKKKPASRPIPTKLVPVKISPKSDKVVFRPQTYPTQPKPSVPMKPIFTAKPVNVMSEKQILPKPNLNNNIMGKQIKVLVMTDEEPIVPESKERVEIRQVNNLPNSLRVHYSENPKERYKVKRTSDLDTEPNLGPKIVKGLELRQRMK